ncbi:MAG TPA: TonB-dependent receptor [Gemmatimonadaceae bacterium]|nr:TonB-dependent receptor [Gemmatimonadaceae bacterium]
MVSHKGLIMFFAAISAAASTPLSGQNRLPADSSRVRALDTIRITGRIDDLIGSAGTASEGRVGAEDLRARPITREGELLETVPGLVVTQHSGEGKANQYFVRGFNLDHGTDFQMRIEGMPLNMPTHGHGQGWTDLNFLIPEFVDRLEYRLGVYHPEVGDFGSAGGAELHLIRTLERPFGKVNAGENGLARMVGGGSRRVGSGDLLFGGEVKAYDGPWELAEKIRKRSGLARYSWGPATSRFSVLGMAYANRWNSNDQVPRRAVDRGLIGRFGQIDSTDGGASQRYSLSGSWRRVGARSVLDVEAFGVQSDLDLFSNFTYFLEDPERGDQFNQLDKRSILGVNVTHLQQAKLLGAEHAVTAGLQTRADFIYGLGLHKTESKVRFATVRTDRVTETGTGLFAKAESRWSSTVRSILGLRADAYTFGVTSDRPENSGSNRAAIVSPKASLVYTPSLKAEFYLSGGYGFHSNDARGTTITIDPATGDPAERVDPLVRSVGGEIGMRAAPVKGLRSTLTLWTLELDSELLFVGDAGATEPSPATRRSGVTLANFYRPIPGLSIDADVSFAKAKLAEPGPDGQHIPGALENVLAAGVIWTPGEYGSFGALRLRHLGSYPLIEDNSVRADRSTLVNADLGHSWSTGFTLQATLLNVLNARGDDIQYSYTSRLRGEPAAGVDDRHSHPVEPRQIRLSLTRTF